MTVNWRQVAFQSAVNAGHPDPDMFVRQMIQESGLRPHTNSSSAGAQGIAQIMPATAKGWGVDPHDPYASLNAAAKAMTKYFKSYNGNAAMALAAYNAGPGAVAQYRGVPPYGETQHYVKTIMNGKPVMGGQQGQPSPMPGQRPAPVARQVPGADPIAVSNQINRIQYAYGQHGALAQPHIDKLAASLTGPSQALSNPTLEPAGVKATEGKDFFERGKGETFQVYMDRLLQKKFGLKHDAGNSQTTGGHHMEGSRHYVGGATDFGNALNKPRVIDQAVNWANENKNNIVGLEDVIWQDGGAHDNHAHFEGRSSKGISKSPTPTSIRPTNSRRRPVKKNRIPR